MIEWIVVALLVALLAVQTWYYVEKVWDLNRTHQRHLEELNHEYKMQTQMMRSLTLPMMEVNDE